MSQVLIVSSVDLFRAQSWSVGTFLAYPCGECNHGAGQHHWHPDKKHAKKDPKKNYRCTATDCECIGYVEAEFYFGA
jgi:hypothetical protein